MTTNTNLFKPFFSTGRAIFFVCVFVFALPLAACGGGGDSTQSSASAQAQAQDMDKAITQAATNIAASMPKIPEYTGAFASVEGVAVGFISGKSDREVATTIATMVKNSPATYPTMYQRLLSDAGLKITVHGKQSSIKSVTGIPIMLPDSHYTAKLTTNGLVVSQ